MDVFGSIEAIALIIAIATLTCFGVMMIMLDIAMHRNVKWLIGDVIVTYLLYIAFRILFAFASQLPSWLATIGYAGFLLCLTASAIDSSSFIVERVIASRYPKTYEQWGSSLAWITIAIEWLLSVIFTAIDLVWSGELIVESIVLVLQFFGILIFIYIINYNKRKYNETYIARFDHTLSERYQIAENIRITRELMPFVVSCLLRSTLIVILLIASSFRYTPSDLFYGLGYLTMVFHAILTPFTIIIFNPKLYGKCKQVLLCGHKSNAVNVVARTAVGGQQLVNADQHSRHFEMLKQAWN